MTFVIAIACRCFSQALLASKIVSYAQGFMLLQEAAKAHGWNLNFGEIALMWRGGCIIRSAFLGKIKEAYDRNPNLENLMLADYFVETLSRCQAGWREVISQVTGPTPSALASRS